MRGAKQNTKLTAFPRTVQLLTQWVVTKSHRPILKFLFIGIFIVIFGSACTTKIPQSLSECAADYKRLLDRDVLSIRIVFGYKDTRPARFVGDRHERLALIQRLLATCQDGNQSCGFRRDPADADLFVKTWQHNPITGKPLNIQVLVVNSSVGTDDQANRLDPLQKWQSQRASDVFYSGIKEAQIVFYNGHSRFGFGPDFEPPRINKSGFVDSPHYRDRPLGLFKLLHALKSGASGQSPQLQLLGLFSCASSQHFTGEIQNSLGQSSKVGLITSPNLIYHSDALENSLSVLSALLQMQCPGRFAEALNQGKKHKAMSMQGFWLKD